MNDVGLRPCIFGGLCWNNVNTGEQVMVSTWVPFHITPLSPPLPLVQLILTREMNWQETETDRGKTQI